MGDDAGDIRAEQANGYWLYHANGGREDERIFGDDCTAICRYVRAQGKDNAIGFAMSEAVVRKNLMGSDVEVEGNPGEATLNLKSDGFLMTAINLIKKGLLPITKEDFQRGCIEGYFRPRAEKLGLELDVEYTDEGYGIKISKK
ncbi:hypothetical protein CW713_00280 [Methanophagales archaeon]|nr:MAG: hypothetical protein CW713_00280 [Methanophagales archaeon]